MMKKHWILIVVIILGIIFFSRGLPFHNRRFPLPKNKPGEIAKAKDLNDDGNMDMWTFVDQNCVNSVPVRWVRDSDFDGSPDQWGHLKNGKVFFEQEDRNRDGKIDALFFNIRDEEKNKTRRLMFVLDGDLFVEKEDTGWREIQLAKGKDNTDNRVAEDRPSRPARTPK